MSLFLPQVNDNHSSVSLQLFLGAVDSTLEAEETVKSPQQAWGFAFILASKQCPIQTVPLFYFAHSANKSSVCHRWSSPSPSLCPLQLLAMPYQWPQSFLRMWRILRPRFDFHGLTRLLVLTINRPVFQSSWPATTYSDPGEESRALTVNVTEIDRTGEKSLWEAPYVKRLHIVI